MVENKRKPTSGNRTSARGHRPRAGIIKRDGDLMLRLSALGSDELFQVRAAVKAADDTTLTTWERAASALLLAIQNEQGARFDRADAAGNTEEARRILEELSDASGE